MKLASLIDFRNLTVRASLMLCGVLVVVGNLIVLMAYFYSASIETNVQAEVARVTQIKLTAGEVEQGFLTARYLEQQFLVDKTPELMDQHTEIIGSTIDLSAKFLELVQGNEKLVGITGELDEAMVTYADDFQQVFDQQTVLGYTPDLGVQGQMRGAIRDLESKLEQANQLRLTNLVLQLRRNEKDFLLRSEQKYVDQFTKVADELARELGGSGLDEALRKGLEQGLSLYRARFAEMAQGRMGIMETEKSMDTHGEAVEPVLESMFAAADELQKEIEASAGTRRALARTIVIGTLLLVAGLLVGAFLLITRRVAPPLAEAARFCAEIAEGDLRRDIPVGRKDEIGDLLGSLAGMSTRLREVVGDVRGRTLSINHSASEISQGNTDLSQRTEQQAANLEETASSMEQMTSTVKQNSDNARQANQLANAARDQAEKGGQVVAGAVRAMGEISAASKKIADIIGVVDEIAFQTNLLALNAAVEAARAGEQGRGFAVVATEVRSLAQRSAEAAKEIKDLISDSVGKVAAGSKLVDQTGTTLAELVAAVKKVSDIVSEIAAASLEQSDGIEQVNKAVMQMDEVTQQNAALVEQAAASAKSLEDQADAMAQAVAFFKLSDGHSAAAPRQVPEPRAREVDLSRQRAAPRPAAPPPPSAPGEPERRPETVQRQQPAAAGYDAEWEEF